MRMPRRPNLRLIPSKEEIQIRERTKMLVNLHHDFAKITRKTHKLITRLKGESEWLDFDIACKRIDDLENAPTKKENRFTKDEAIKQAIWYAKLSLFRGVTAVPINFKMSNLRTVPPLSIPKENSNDSPT